MSASGGSCDAKNSRWVAGNYSIIRHIFCYDAARNDSGTLADSDAAKDRGPGTDRRPLLDQGRHAGPVGFGLKISLGGCCARVTIIYEDDAMADKDLVFDLHTFANEGMA